MKSFAGKGAGPVLEVRLERRELPSGADGISIRMASLLTNCQDISVTVPPVERLPNSDGKLRELSSSSIARISTNES
jgi:hypothetical protein